MISYFRNYLKRMPFHPCGAILPVACFFSMLGTDYHNVINVVFLYTVLLLFSLCAPGAFKNASCAEPGVRRVDSRFLGSLITAAVASLLTFALITLVQDERFTVTALLTAVFMVFEQLFEERLFAVGRLQDADLLSFTSALLLIAGTFLGFMLYGAAVGLIIAVIVTFCNQPVRFRKPIFSIRYAPRALLQDFVPLAVLFSAARFTDLSYAAIPCCWIFFRLFRTFARCSSDETRLPLFLLSLFLLVSAVPPYDPEKVFTAVAMGLTGLLCILIDFDLSAKTIAAAVIFAASAVLYYLHLYPFAAGTALIACIVSFDRRIFLRKV